MTEKRAGKACRRCSSRKIKCDVVSQPSGEPCSRCRMDKVGDECYTLPSRRGTYERTLQHRKRSRHTRTSSVVGESSYNPSVQLAPSSSYQGRDASIEISQDNHTAPRSLAAMFEDFLDATGYDRDDTAAGQLGIVLFGESSPLTFALQDSTQESPSVLYNTAPDLSRSKSRGGLAYLNQHPPHCSAEEIAFLSARGAFTAPENELRDQLVAAFVDRFYPLHAIFNKGELLEMNRTRALKWILLHAICFIGATFCDAGILHGSAFKSRLHARRLFYNRAKVLFDTGYETDKFSLLQSTIMMSFWGPQMKSYWNPCSWIGFAVTIAESLGIHRSNSSADVHVKDKGLLRRLWWSLAVRDTYCAALLGRPFRIDLDRCDTEMLEMNDFGEDVTLPTESHDHALYQIHVARLSVILRSINQNRFRPLGSATLFCQLDQWWESTPSISSTVFNISFQVLYHFHRILIHLNEARSTDSFTTEGLSGGTTIMDSAQKIASTASALVTQRIATQIPHEMFTGYFLAGIVLYRQLQRNEGLPSQVARSSFDNCQMLLNEIRETWDSEHWIMRIFDFLLSFRASSDHSEAKRKSVITTAPPAESLEKTLGGQASAQVMTFPLDLDDLYCVDWSSPLEERTFGDLGYMPPFLDHLHSAQHTLMDFL